MGNSIRDRAQTGSALGGYGVNAGYSLGASAPVGNFNTSQSVSATGPALVMSAVLIGLVAFYVWTRGIQGTK